MRVTLGENQLFVADIVNFDVLVGHICGGVQWDFRSACLQLRKDAEKT